MRFKLGNKEVSAANTKEGINVLLQEMTRGEINPVVVLKTVAVLSKFTSKTSKSDPAAQNAINNALAFVEAYQADDLAKAAFFASIAIIDDLAIHCGGLGSKDPRFDAIFVKTIEAESESIAPQAPQEDLDEALEGFDENLLDEIESMHNADDDDQPWS